MRSIYQKALDFIFFPIRSTMIFYENKWGLTCLANERYEYVSKYVSGYCLDVGCGSNNFIKIFRNNNGKGIDVFLYEGLNKENIVDDLTHFPFSDETFDSVTFIANVNHIPKPERQKEINEAYRVLKKGGNIIITMGNPIAEILAHKTVFFYDRIFKTQYDIDNVRGMTEYEEYYLRSREIKNMVINAGFINIRKKYFLTQWLLNHLFIGFK